MELLLELLLEVLGEALLTIFGEAIKSTLPGGAKDHPARAMAVFVLLGALFGGLSALVVPRPLVHGELLRLAVFLGSPTLCALCLWGLARLRGRSGNEAPVHGFLLGLGYQLARLVALAIVR